MKKILLFVIMFCCLSSVTAQSFDNFNINDLSKKIAFRHLDNNGAKGITHRIDSMVLINGGIKFTPVYDRQFKCVRDSVFLVNTFFYYLDYTYNNENQLIIIQGSELSNTKIELSYNAQGLVSDVLSYKNENGNWILDNRTMTGYDTNGHPTVEYYFTRTGSGDWEYESKTEYTFNNDQLVVMIESYWQSASNTWRESNKSEYEYDEMGNCINKLRYEKASDNSWSLSQRYENLYDTYNNVIQIRRYACEGGKGETLDYITSYRYITTVSRDAIACSEYLGYNFFENEVIHINQLLISIEEYDVSSDFTLLHTNYVTDMTNVDEQPTQALQLWPNPVHETLSVDAQNLRQVAIFTIDGREVLLVKDGFDAIQVSQLANGCYLLKATLDDGSVAAQKFIKQ